jgi:hypothetical protein
MGSLLFSVGLLVVGAFFLGVALDFQGWNTGMARVRAEWRSEKKPRGEDAFDDYHALNRAIGLVGAVVALLFALVIAIESLAGFHPGH